MTVGQKRIFDMNMVGNEFNIVSVAAYKITNLEYTVTGGRWVTRYTILVMIKPV